LHDKTEDLHGGEGSYCDMLLSAYLPYCTVLVLWYAGVCISTRLHDLSIVVCWCLHTYQTVRYQYCGMLVSAYVPDCAVSKWKT